MSQPALISLVGSAIVAYFFPITDASPVVRLALILLNTTCFYTIYLLIIFPFLLNPVRNLPKPNGFLPILGHGYILFQRPQGQPHFEIMKKTPNNGLILTYGIFHTTRILLTSPEALADVLVHKSYDFEKLPGTRAFLRKFLGDGLLIVEGDEHRHHRKHIQPAFHFRHIKELYPVFWAKSVEFCNVMKSSLAQNSSNVLELGYYSTKVTLDIIGLAGLGRDIGSLRNDDDELADTFEEILQPTKEKAVFFLLHVVFPPWLIGLLPWKLKERVKVTTARLRRICGEFLAERKVGKGEDKTSDSRDILSIMIRSNNFSDHDLVDQLLTFIAAGHETTSSALTWASYLLSKHPDAQKRLREEIREHIPDPRVLSEPGYDIASVLENMPYLNGVCNEVLRLYPTVPITARIAVRDVTVAGQNFPKGTNFFVVPWAINRMATLWGPQAEEFIPERWIDKETGRATMNGGADTNYAFLTFLHGPRSCIGEKFARAEFRALVVAFVGAFEMELADPNEKVEIGGTITSKPVNGMKLKLKPLDWL